MRLHVLEESKVKVPNLGLQKNSVEFENFFLTLFHYNVIRKTWEGK